MASIGNDSGLDKASLEKPYSYTVNPTLVKSTQELLTLSFLLGLDHATSDLDLSPKAKDGQMELGLADDVIPALSFDDALSFLKGRVSLTKSEWKNLEPKLRFRAFTVAALAEPDSIEKVRKHLIDSLDNGGDLSKLWNIDQLQKMAGLHKTNPWYWENVYRTNAQTAYNAGRAMEFTRNQPTYLEFIGVEDLRQTDICAQRVGTILPATHPFWKSNWPPLHFSCRSTVRGIYKAEVDVMREEDPNWPTVTQKLAKTKTAKGFGGNPIENNNYWDITDSMAKRAEKFGVLNNVREFADKLGLKSVRLNISPETLKECKQVSDNKKIYVHPDHGTTELTENLEHAKVWADRGEKVYLLPRTDYAKTMDAYMMKSLWEFKRPKNTTKTSIDRSIRDALDQASNIYLDLQKFEDYKMVERGIKGRVSLEPSIEKVAFKFKDKIFVFSRIEILKPDWQF